MSLDRFCRKTVVTAPLDEPVVQVAQRMRDLHVGAVVAVDERGRPKGMITDRDLVCRVLAEGRSPQTLRVREVMTPDVEVLQVHDAIDGAVGKMRALGLRRLPIVDAQGQLSGMVSLDDLMVLLSAELGSAVGAVRENRGP